MIRKYELIKNELLKEIEQAASEGHSCLPTEEELCGKYTVSRQTLRKAADMLIMEGYIYRRKGSGSYLTEKAIQLQRKNLAFIIDNDNEYTNPLLISSLYEALKVYGISLEIHITDGKYNNERSILKTLLKDSPSAILIKPIKSALPNPNVNIINNIIDNGIPVFFLEESYVKTNSEYCAYKDEYISGYDMANYLATNEHTNFATLLKIDETSGHIKFKGINDALNNLNIEILDQNILWYSDSEIEIMRKKTDTSLVLSYLSELSDTCSCIICQNDEIAYWINRALSVEDNYKDIVVVSFDNTYLSTFGNSTFASVDFNYGDYCKLIAQNIYNELTHHKLNVISCEWSKPHFNL